MATVTHKAVKVHLFLRLPSVYMKGNLWVFFHVKAAIYKLNVYGSNQHLRETNLNREELRAVM